MGKVFQPVQRQSTREQVCTAIREAIFSGRLKIGERLREIHLAKELHVSRSVIREAFQQLGHEGLLVLSPFKGAQVVDLSPQEVDEIIGLRVLLEGEAVRLAKAKLSPSDERYLNQLADDLQASRNPPELFAHLDFKLHQTLWGLSGNETLVRHLSLLTAPVFSFGNIVRHSPVPGAIKALDDRRGDHKNLVRQICRGTATEAVEAIQEHIRENWARTRAAIDHLHIQANKANQRHSPAAPEKHSGDALPPRSRSLNLKVCVKAK